MYDRDDQTESGKEKRQMQIRKAGLEDLTEIMKIYEHARAFMVQTGNKTQWSNGYPQEALLRQDIADGICYVGEEDGELETVFVYFEGDDPTYHVIEQGNWVNQDPYGVVHRIASRGRIKGAGAQCILWGFEQCGNLKMDTHDDNKVMQHVLEKNGFVKCGRIYTHDGTERIAYQKIRKE